MLHWLFFTYDESRSRNLISNIYFHSLVSLNTRDNFIKKETLAQAFSCEFGEIFKNTDFHGTLPVAASVAKLLEVLDLLLSNPCF